MLRTILFAAVASSSSGFMLPSAAAALSLQHSNGFEDSPAEQISTRRSTSHTPSPRRLLDDGASRTDATAATQVALTLRAAPKRADHLASTDDPIDECVAVLANGEEPDEEMLAKCQDIAREEFANQATLEDENSY